MAVSLPSAPDCFGDLTMLRELKWEVEVKESWMIGPGIWDDEITSYGPFDTEDEAIEELKRQYWGDDLELGYPIPDDVIKQLEDWSVDHSIEWRDGLEHTFFAWTTERKFDIKEDEDIIADARRLVERAEELANSIGWTMTPVEFNS